MKNSRLKLFSSHYRIFAKTNNMLGHISSLSKCERIEGSDVSKMVE